MLMPNGLMLDRTERLLMLKNPLLQRVLRGIESDEDLNSAVERELHAILHESISDERLTAIELAINATLDRFPPEALMKLFENDFEIKELFQSFYPIVEFLRKASRRTDEYKRLGLQNLWCWYWARDLVAHRRHLLRNRRDYDITSQKPYFFRPGIPSRTFWAIDELAAEFRKLEEAYPDILRELQSIRRDGTWLPYRTVEYGDPITSDGTPASSMWNGFFFYHPLKGKFTDNHLRCPITSAVLESLPGLCRDDLVLFSALVPGGVIPPHHGPINGRLRVQLALTGTEGCCLRVGTQIRQWQEGKVLVFDDSFEHQVCHNGPDTRVVLMMNILQPDLPETEKRYVEEIVRASMKDYVGSSQDASDIEALSKSNWWK